MSLKGVVESSLLFKDEPLILNIGKVRWFDFLEGGLKIEKLATIGRLDSGFCFFLNMRKRNPFRPTYLRNLEAPALE